MPRINELLRQQMKNGYLMVSTEDDYPENQREERLSKLSFPTKQSDFTWRLDLETTEGASGCRVPHLLRGSDRSIATLCMNIHVVMQDHSG